LNPSHPSWRRSRETEERRRAPRYDTRLESRLLFTLSSGGQAAGDEQGEPALLTGYTRNLSETGLALVVPSLRLGQQSLNRVGSDLTIHLALPTGEVRIEATPVYSLRLLAGDEDTGYLVGVRIRKMLDQEWVRLVQYVQGLAAES
jgi:hypothetical protein